MKIITDILALFPADDCIRIKSGGFMPLVIERIGGGPRGLPLVSVAHYYEQNGDLMRDPEMTFEHGADGKLHPVSFQQDGGFAIYQTAVFQNEAGQTLIRPKLISQLNSFSKTWSGNLRNQGFLKEAKAKAKATASFSSQ